MISIYPNGGTVSILSSLSLYLASETDGSVRGAGDGSRGNGGSG